MNQAEHSYQKERKAVHNINGKFRSEYCRLRISSSKITAIATTMTIRVLATTAGVIQGLRVQSTEPEFPDEASDIFKTCSLRMLSSDI
jgi:hypothetical protein